MAISGVEGQLLRADGVAAPVATPAAEGTDENKGETKPAEQQPPKQKIDEQKIDEQKPEAGQNDKPAEAKQPIVKKPAVKKVAPQRLLIPVQAPQQDAQIKQWEQQLQPLLVAELNFVRHVCEIPPAARPQVRAAGERGRTAAARFLAGRRGPDDRSRTASAEVQAEIAKTLKEVLSPEQLANYQSEINARDRARRRAAVRVVTCRLELALNLEPDQSEKIAEAIDGKWQADWESWLQLSRFGDEYFPELPANLIEPHLQDTQRELWAGLQKINLGSYVGNMMQPVDDPAWWEGEAPPPVDPPETGQAAAAAKNTDAGALGKVFLKALGNVLKPAPKKP